MTLVSNQEQALIEGTHHRDLGWEWPYKDRVLMQRVEGATLAFQLCLEVVLTSLVVLLSSVIWVPFGWLQRPCVTLPRRCFQLTLLLVYF